MVQVGTIQSRSSDPHSINRAFVVGPEGLPRNDDRYSPSGYDCISQEEAEQVVEIYNTAVANGEDIFILQALDRARKVNGTPLPLPTTPYDPEKGAPTIYLMQQGENTKPDSIRECVVLAHSRREAYSIHPGGYEVETCLMNTWLHTDRRHHITLTELGIYTGTDRGAGSVLTVSWVGGDHRTPWGDVERRACHKVPPCDYCDKERPPVNYEDRHRLRRKHEEVAATA